jgi:hypothetical protein
MSKYIVVEGEKGYRRILDNDGLKELLINETQNYVYENYREKEIIVDNFELMKNLALGNCKTDEIIERLEYYGYCIRDLFTLEEDLSIYQAYMHGTGIPSGCIPRDCIYETLELINTDIYY